MGRRKMAGKEGKCLWGAWHEGHRRRRPDMRGVLPAHGVYDGGRPVAQLRLGPVLARAKAAASATGKD